MVIKSVTTSPTLAGERMLFILQVSILSEQTHDTQGNSFPSLLSLITCQPVPHSPTHPPSPGDPATPTLTHHSNDSTYQWGRREGVCKCSGKYTDIYFILKITYPISTLPEHLHSTNPDINRMAGCAISISSICRTGNGDTNNTNSPWVMMP